MFALVRNDHLQCDTNPLHMYPLHISQCPWCSFKEDYFPQDYANVKNLHDNIKNRVFNYLNELLTYFAVDGKISKEELEKYKAAAKTEYLSDDMIEIVFNDFIKANPQVMVGDGLEMSQKGLYFGLITTEQNIVTKRIMFTNKLLYEDIKITITWPHQDYIVVSPKSITLSKGKQHEFEISLMPKKIKLPSGNYNELIQVNWESVSYRNYKNIPIVYEFKQSFNKSFKLTIRNTLTCWVIILVITIAVFLAIFAGETGRTIAGIIGAILIMFFKSIRAPD